MSHTDRPTVRLRTAFISDVHLGTRACRAEPLLDFLQSIDVETLVLVGDLIDVQALQRSVFWPPLHGQVVRTILRKAREGTRVIYVPGNHDEVFRELAGMRFGSLEIRQEFVHRTRDGQRLLVLHGDEFDSAVNCSRWLASLGSWIYEGLVRLGRHVNALRRLCGLPYWSLAGYLKQRVGNAARYIERFEYAAAAITRRRRLDGVICGHIHRAALKSLDGVLYCNDGDWVESCTALVEDLQGRLALWDWIEERTQVAPRYLEPIVDHAA